MIYVKEYNAPPINYSEILRYASAKESSEVVDELIEDCISELDDLLSFKICYGVFKVENNVFDIGSEITYSCNLSFTKTVSKDLYTNLKDCSEFIVFASTIGLEIDRLIRKYSHISPAKAVVLQAYGAERIESLCNVFIDDIKKEDFMTGKVMHPRFSPGYGDLSINIQKDIFKVLDCSKHIGLSLNNNLLMSPSKSATAIIGIEKENYYEY